METNKIKSALDALQPIIFVNTVEPVRFRDLFLFPAVQASRIPIKGAEYRRVTRLTPTSCQQWTGCNWSKATDLSGSEEANWFGMIKEVRRSRCKIPKLETTGEFNDPPMPDLLWMSNFDQQINPGDKQDAALIDFMIEAAIEFESTPYKHIVVTGAALRVPEALRPFVEVIDIGLPDEKEIGVLVDGILDRYKTTKVKVDQKVVKSFVRNSCGLSEFEVKQSLANAIATHRAFDENAPIMAQRRKQQKAKDSGVLEIRDVKKTLADVGGLERLKSYIEGIKPTIAAPEAAKKYGVRVPSGILLAGVPGSGKSLACEAIAGTLEIGFARFSMGAIMDKWVGGSEGNLYNAFKMIAAIAPCVVMFDEFEKMLTGDGAGNSTFLSCKGILLTWLEEKPAGVFVAMTCNDMRPFDDASNNALIRSGRVDKILFVDYPSADAREEIFRIHLAKAGGHPFKGNISKIISASYGFSGAEIKEVVESSIREAFAIKLEHPTPTIIQSHVEAKKPQSKTLKTSIDVLRQWVKDGRAEMAGTGFEDDLKSGRMAAMEATSGGLDKFGAIGAENTN